MSSSLSHAKSHVVTYDQLQALPAPQSLGPRHHPVAHDVLVDALRLEATRRGLHVAREQFAINAKGTKVFGVLDLARAGVSTDGVVVWEPGPSFGFRNGTEQEFAIRGVAGQRVFVCDNLTLMGDTIAIARKNTTGLDLAAALIAGFDKFIEHASALDQRIMRLQAQAILDSEAKAMIFDAINSQVVPVRLFGDVAAYYFHPTDEMTDCTPRTAYGLYNAFTRAVKQLNPMAGWAATVALGHQFGLRVEAAAEGGTR